MSDTATMSADDDLDIPEMTEFSKGVRGKYYERATGSPLPIHLDDDIRAVFPDERSVNEALRTLIRLRQSLEAD